MISVIVPAFNAEHTIGRTLAAILRQTVPPAAIIVVNDGSTDGTEEAVARFRDPRIRVAVQPNAGVSAARNRGLAEARTEVVAFCDADDEWLPGFLETIAGLRRNYPQAAVYATAYRIAPPDGAAYDVRLRGLPFAGADGILSNYFEVAGQSDPPLNSSVVAVRKDALEWTGGFPEGIVSGEDLLTWARLALQWRIAYSRFAMAVRHCPHRLNFNRPSRTEDSVSAAFDAMLQDAPAALKPALRLYLTRWHEMRAVVALGQSDPARARSHLRKVFREYRTTSRSLALAAMCSLPAPVSLRLFRSLRTSRRLRPAA